MNHLIQQFLCLFSVIHCVQIAPGYWLCLFPCITPVLFNVCQLEVWMKYCIEYISLRNKDRKNLNVKQYSVWSQTDCNTSSIYLSHLQSHRDSQWTSTTWLWLPTLWAIPLSLESHTKGRAFSLMKSIVDHVGILFKQFWLDFGLEIITKNQPLRCRPHP